MIGRLLSRILFGLEAAGVAVVYGLVRLLPLDAASSLGAAILRRVGPLLGPHRIARRNLERAFPERSPSEIATILDGMWANLGRTAGEFAHLPTLVRELDDRVEVLGGDIAARFARDGGPAIFISGHFANWEVFGIAAARHGIPLDMIYRAPNNPLLRGVFDSRKPHPDTRLIAKGSDGARQVMRSLRDRRFLGLLIDQKLNDGIEARFFGRPAMTAPAFAQLARRFACPIVPVHIERLDGVRFRITVCEPFVPDPEADVPALVQRYNDLLESWVREHPEQWFWVHRRWRDKPAGAEVAGAAR